MDNNPHGIVAGQKLFRVQRVNRSRHGHNESWVEVVKVGRKWATLKHRERVDLVTLAVDGREYTSPADCYLTEKAYRDEARRDTLLQALRQGLSFGRLSREVTLADVEAALDLLKIEHA